MAIPAAVRRVQRRAAEPLPQQEVDGRVVVVFLQRQEVDAPAASLSQLPEPRRLAASAREFSTSSPRHERGRQHQTLW